MSNEQKRDLALFQGQYIFIQDGSKGVIKVISGPNVITPSAQDKPVTYDHKKGTFVTLTSLEEAVRKAAVAVEGFYIELLNPTKDNVHPQEGQNQPSPDLLVGRKINIPGPTMFNLWPGQVATTIRGHHLRSNQYLLCRVYNDEEAKKNWNSAIIKKASTLTPPPDTASQEEKAAFERAVQKEKSANLPPPDFTVGKLFIIRGTDVSFYIPPTGITVVPEGEDSSGNLIYARDALTLERLEYAVLVDENGKKRYEVGPAVVFPNPTERFVTTKEEHSKIETKKFRAIELNDLQGIHIKVIADYTEGGKKFSAGEEIFITGKNTPIYYPREEHAAVKYDGKTKHFASAIPAGEARYVMNRMSGEIKMVEGPFMLLPDPRTEIIVRRVLTDKQTMYWYPGNAEALEYNRSLRSIAANSPTTRQGAVSEGEIERNSGKSSRMAGIPGAQAMTKGNIGQIAYATTTQMAESSNVSREQGIVGEELTRSSGYTQPRTLTLETKYQGVPTIELWTNYAVQVVSKRGDRRVEVGPKAIKLQYDESLEVLELSTGKPKNTDNLLRTVYLRVANNKVSDRVYVETSDHVRVDLSLSYVVNFEGQSEKWFSVENYVKFLCDHLRSELKNLVRQYKVGDFYADSTKIIHKLLGEDKKGLLFQDNNMRLSDIEVLGVEIKDERIIKMISESQNEVIRSNIEIANLTRDLEVSAKRESIQQQKAALTAETAEAKAEADKRILSSQLSVQLARLLNQLSETAKTKELEAARQALEAQKTEAALQLHEKTRAAELAFEEKQQALKISLLQAEVQATVERFKALDPNFTSALLSLSNNEALVKVTEAMNLQRALGGDNVVDSFHRIFAGTPLAEVVKKIASPQNVLPSASTPNGKTVSAS